MSWVSFSSTIVSWIFGYWWFFLLERLLHGLSMCLWPSYCFLTLIYWLPTTARFGSFLADFGYKRCFLPPPPPPPHALLFHWWWCAPSRSHLRVFLPCFILWQVWKARNAFRFDPQPFSINAIIYRVVSDLGLLILPLIICLLNWGEFRVLELRRVCKS